MSRRRAHQGFHEPSLVPLADMLCNTVGVVVFILIFTVLSASSAVLRKRLPYEKDAPKKNELMMLCKDDRVVPVHADDLQQEFVKENKVPQFSSVNEATAWFSSRSVQDEYCKLMVKINDFGSTELVVTPIENAGDPTVDMDHSDSVIHRELAKLNPESDFVYFFVYPSGLGAFDRAREIADNMQFQTGWAPHSADRPLLFGSGGNAPTVQ